MRILKLKNKKSKNLKISISIHLDIDVFSLGLNLCIANEAINKHVKTPLIKSKVGAPIKLKTLKTTLITKEHSAITPDVNTNFLIFKIS